MKKFLEKFNLNSLKPSPLKLLLSFIWMVIFLLLGELNPTLYLFSLPGLVYFCGSILSLIIFAWIINPIKNITKK
jgi:hypothetical protein